MKNGKRVYPKNARCFRFFEKYVKMLMTLFFLVSCHKYIKTFRSKWDKID